jgi:CAI-1 autoinducer synthase
LREGLRSLGYAVDLPFSQVIALRSGTEYQTVSLRDALEQHGIFGAVFCAPATPKNHALVRLSVNAGLTPGDIDRVIAACKQIVETRPISPWPRHLLLPEMTDGRAHNEQVETAHDGDFPVGVVPAIG